MVRRGKDVGTLATCSGAPELNHSHLATSPPVHELSTELHSKRAFDVILALFGLAVSAPLWILIAVSIWIDDGRPIFYCQQRVGKNGTTFMLLKFRSMIRDAEAAYGPVAALERDPRITTVGRLLRKSAIDELPQLISILKGDMSFVGPRADRPWESETDKDGFLKNSKATELGFDPDTQASGNPAGFLRTIPGYRERLAVRPGLTGIAQIYGSQDTPRRQKLRLDRLYLRRMSLCLDAKLILLSVWITLRGKWECRTRKF